ncbi:hypothetical protein POL68_21725 [Stigmatella sp. ncwal1]|uniref:Uncharacterized protein n=1 Tax=Stigmatella ashevillensis TaxID=2995309 RepID=A0ABT5DBP8_9BACT|nr:hypothetical protein [Stigmatella ashevillena]MDC0711104.1 hypothetical protein [Stigmatella ashevillena]
MEGIWTITQTWQGIPAYKFSATFAANGTITVDGGYFGVWDRLGNSNQVSLAIANFGQSSITAYVGNVVGPAMGGQMTGCTKGGTPLHGEWSAAQQQHADAVQGALRPPGER